MKTRKKDLTELQNDNTIFFEDLYKFYFKRLYGYACRFTQDREMAHDIVNECFLKIWKNRKELTHENLAGYLFRMVRNESLDYLTHLQYKDAYRVSLLYEMEKQESLEYYTYSNDPESLYMVEELKNNIYHIIENLPEQCKRVFNLSREEGLKNREIAEKLEINIKTVEYHISNALKTIHKELQNKFPV